MARSGPLRRRPAARDTLEDTLDLYDRTLVDAWPAGVWLPDSAVPERRPRTSFRATLGLILGLVALCATLTGLLAPEGLALAVLASLACVAGLVGASRHGITGHSLAVLGLLAALAASVLAVAAITGHLSWLSTDTVARLHGWLVAHWRPLRDW